MVWAFVLTIIPSENGLINFEGDKFQASLNNFYFSRFHGWWILGQFLSSLLCPLNTNVV